MSVELGYIRNNFQEEDTSELIEILEAETIVHTWTSDKKEYTIHIQRDKLDFGNFQGTLINVEDALGRFKQIVKYPSSTDSFYSSCINAIKLLRERKFS